MVAMVSSTRTMPPIGFLTRDPIGYVDGKSLYSNYMGQKATDPTGLETVEEMIRRLGGRGGCVTMSRQEWQDWRRRNGYADLTPEQSTDIDRGCIGFVATNQQCDRNYPPPHGPNNPEDTPGSTCFKTDGEVRKFKCAAGTTPYPFIKFGRWCGAEPPDGQPIEPGKGICANANGTFNYFSCTGTYCVDMNHCRMNQQGNCAAPNEPTSNLPEQQQSIRFCDHLIPPGGEYPNAMYCITCKKCGAAGNIRR